MGPSFNDGLPGRVPCNKKELDKKDGDVILLKGRRDIGGKNKPPKKNERFLEVFGRDIRDTWRKKNFILRTHPNT